MMNKRRIVISVGAAIALAILGGVNASSEKAGKAHVVTITGFEFVPNELSVSVGDTITWVNQDIVPHTASSKDGNWDTGTINQKESKSLTVTKEMTSSYYCRFHISMIGSVIFDSREVVTD